MKTIIAGSRTIDDMSLLIDAVMSCGFDITEVVCGGATGVDELGKRWAIARHIPVNEFPANWKVFGASAGPMRNEEMALYADALLAIWDGKSRGTEDMIRRANRHDLFVYVYRTDEPKIMTY